MTAWIVTNGELWRKTPELRRSEIRGWLTVNGIDVNRVPSHSEVTVRENSEGIWVIDFEQYQVDNRGRVLLDGKREARIQARTVPVQLDPPLYLLTEIQDAGHDDT